MDMSESWSQTPSLFYSLPPSLPPSSLSPFYLPSFLPPLPPSLLIDSPVGAVVDRDAILLTVIPFEGGGSLKEGGREGGREGGNTCQISWVEVPWRREEREGGKEGGREEDVPPRRTTLLLGRISANPEQRKT